MWAELRRQAMDGKPYDPLYLVAKLTASGLLIPNRRAVCRMAARLGVAAPYGEKKVQRLAISVKRKLEPTLDPWLV
jgi:hypothetical protein